MVNIDDKEEKRAKEILIRNYNILEYGVIDEANPTNISLRIHRDLDYRTSDGYFYYNINENRLEIDFWAENFEDGIKSISTWWAISKAESDPLDKFNQDKRKLYFRAYLPLVFSLLCNYLVMFGSLHYIFPLTGILVSMFFLWKLWKEISEWKKRFKSKARENLHKINYDLSEVDLDTRIRKDSTSMLDRNMSVLMGIIFNITSFIFLLTGVFNLLNM